MSLFESVSTWRQPEPAAASGIRTPLIDQIATTVSHISPGWLRVAIDGLTAAGKTSFGHELAPALQRLGRPTLRTSMDNFKIPGAKPENKDTIGLVALSWSKNLKPVSVRRAGSRECSM